MPQRAQYVLIPREASANKELEVVLFRGALGVVGALVCGDGRRGHCG